jgi:GT2 family glycosyltransferase
LNDLLVTVLIVTWNRKEDVLKTLQSVYQQDYQNIEVLVVDNGSTDGTIDSIKNQFPLTQLVSLSSNLGASGGRNKGIQAARGEIIFLLDSDADLDNSTLSKVVAQFLIEPEIGIIACKIVNAYTRRLSTDLEAGWPYTVKSLANQDKCFLSYRFSEGGAAIRKQVFDKVGLFLDLFYFGREGEELSLRAWDAGYKVLFYPTAIVYHRVSEQKSVTNKKREYFDFRNALLIYIFYYPFWELVRFFPLRILVSFTRGTFRGYLLQCFQVLWEIFRDFPSLSRMRKPIRKSTAKIYFGLLKEHGSLGWDLISWLKYKL